MSSPQKTLIQWNENLKKQMITVSYSTCNDFDFHKILCAHVEYILGGQWGKGREDKMFFVRNEY